MNTFFMFGNYSGDAIKGIAAKRTERARAEIEGFGGKLHSIYALLGTYDLVIIADLPGVQEAVQVSVNLSRETGVSFNTLPAIPIADFDSALG